MKENEFCCFFYIHGFMLIWISIYLFFTPTSNFLIIASFMISFSKIFFSVRFLSCIYRNPTEGVTENFSPDLIKFPEVFIISYRLAEGLYREALITLSYKINRRHIERSIYHFLQNLTRLTEGLYREALIALSKSSCSWTRDFMFCTG